MLDLAGILFSSIMMLIVIVRAVRLDRIQPWFQTATQKDTTEKASPRTPPGETWRRRG